MIMAKTYLLHSTCRILINQNSARTGGIPSLITINEIQIWMLDHITIT